MWQPIADPEMTRRCWGAIEEIERGLVEHMRTESSPLLSGGTAGLALFFAYLYAARKDSEAGDLALEALGRSIDGLATGQLLPSLYSGFCGVGWAVEHLTRELFEGDEDLCSEIDEALRRLASTPAARLQYELINGLSGCGIYLLERLPDPGALEFLAWVLDRLEETAEESEHGLCWQTLPEWLPPWEREQTPEVTYNLGVAHGVPGILGFLAAAQREGVQDPRLPRLSNGAATWIFSQRLATGGDSVFPSVVVPGQAPSPTRTAWCYGDLGIAAVLLSAARSFGRPDWEQEALSVARLAARRPVEHVRAVDAGLCHGTAGNGHLFNRLYQATGDLDLKEAALASHRRALDMRRPGEGFAGFLSYLPSTNGDAKHGTWAGHSGFLTGATGIGLALLAAVSDVEPLWDRVLLTAIPPRLARSLLMRKTGGGAGGRPRAEDALW